jgi:hypothetical protein
VTALADGQLVIGPSTWSQAVHERRPVFECRRCGAAVLPLGEPTTGAYGVNWYEAVCTGCRHPYALPDGRLGPAEVGDDEDQGPGTMVPRRPRRKRS